MSVLDTRRKDQWMTVTAGMIGTLLVIGAIELVAYMLWALYLVLMV